MVAISSISVSAGHVARNAELKVVVKGYRLMRFRLWLGLNIIKLGAAITGCRLTIEMEA